MRTLTTLLLFGSLCLGSAALAQNTTILATADQTTNVRSGPGAQFEIVARLARGDSVTVTGRDAEDTRWLLILMDDGRSGWVMSFSVTAQGDFADLPVIQPGAAGSDTDRQVSVTAYGRVNVRSGPGILYEVIGQLNADDQAPALARDSTHNDWLYIESTALRGWVAYFTVTVTGNPDDLPVRVPDGNGETLVPPSALAITRYNVYLRVQPTLEAAITHLVAFDTPTTPWRRSADSLWIYVEYDGGAGWAIAELFLISKEQVQQLPVEGQPAETSVSPTATADVPQPTAEVSDSGA